MQNSHFQNITSPAYWLSLNPALSITDYPFQSISPVPITDSCIAESIENLKAEGYFQTPPVLDADITSRLATAIQNVVSAGFPAVLAFVYDECWGIIRGIEHMLKPMLSDNYMFSPGDMWIWHIDEHGGSSGWGPHRDLLETSILRPDGSPRIMTTWIPLTDASPLNGCMYLVPTHLDPDYPNNLNERSVGVDTLQNIRALPATAGSLLGWSPMILHWGGRHSGHSVKPRTSIAFYLNDGGPDLGCGMQAKDNTFVPFWYRLGAIGSMLTLFDGSPLAHDLRFPGELKSVLQPYYDRVKSG